MARTKTPAKSSRDLYYSSQHTTSVCSQSGAKSPTTSKADRSRQQKTLNASHNKTQSNRKSIPKKHTSKRGTDVFVQKSTAVVDKSGKKKNIKFKILRDIRFLQSTVHNLIPKRPFSRVVREIMQNCTSNIFYFSSTALEALQEAAEIYLTCLFADCNLLAHHAKRITIKPIDMALALNLRGNP
ncbi:hypothetical protein WA026_000098 [Henosepilachna vigintioctopunctata]|uniref:Core Histone H2A/H2B/H3 domain-containing protein n=1 Tax=Henosepilachna vigintioctopunctata TaxID=420089 RepID=A0AAW1V4Y1_9CUCU